MPALRIVSLIPAATEIVAALGLAGSIVGRSHECDTPPEVIRAEICTEPKIGVHGSSREIHDQITTLLQNALSVYRVHADVIERLAPHVIITQSQCDVCAVSEKDLHAALAARLGEGVQIVALAPARLADVWHDVERVGAALGCAERADFVVKRLTGRVNAIAAGAVRQASRPRVVCIEWIEPLMAAGNWVPELVELAGGENVLGEAGAHSPWTTWDAIVAADPDAIVIMPCGFDLERTAREAATLRALPGYADLRAVRQGRVAVCNGHDYFNRPGPRLVESLEILAEIIHPAGLHFGHENRAWRLFA
jgi:iron complex transport system substrate-binding protein